MAARTTPKQGTPDKPTTASTWKKKAVEGTLLRVPSGNTCLVRAPGIQVFIKEGVIPNTLMPTIQQWMKKAGTVAPKQSELEEMAADPQMIENMLQMTDAVVVYCCLDPLVAAEPKDDNGVTVPLGDAKRDPDLLYVDEVDFADKIFIFNFAVGGSADVTKFRQQQS